MQNEASVEYQTSVVDFLNELIDILFHHHYFVFADSAKRYVMEMREYIEQNTDHVPRYPAPHYFNKYGT